MMTNDSKTLAEDAQIREYAENGTLKAYNNEKENEHIIKITDERGQTTRTTSATRTAVLEGEQLWTIPKNWKHFATDRGHIIYRIPETDVFVSVSRPTGPVSGATYTVETLGSLYLKPQSGVLDREGVVEWVESLDEDENPDLKEVATKLLDNWDEFGQFWFNVLQTYGKSELNDQSDPNDLESITGQHGRVTADIDNNKNLNGLVRHRISSEDGVVDDDLVDELVTNLRDVFDVNDRIHFYYGVSENEDRLPDGYRYRALVEAACSSAEAGDYLMTEIHDMSQSEWAESRNVDPSTVSKNVNAARLNLDVTIAQSH
ncbi:hypothetical protein [Halorubrum sp. FL23]|uniref:hypothetical protein n=1 Tax=Halorubrum sp. FL23 TaxID=3458704 RepID=UPI004034AC12